MTREEAIKRTEQLFAGTNQDVLEALKQPPTLAELLCWNVGILYKVEGQTCPYCTDVDNLFRMDTENGNGNKRPSILLLNAKNIKKLREAEEVSNE
ncbi:MAG: hypothetical protein WBH77_09985 [Saccharofermentanales bacterium]